MFKLPEPARFTSSAGMFWARCARCDGLFPARPGQRHCCYCDPVHSPPVRCEAAHPEDSSPCDGPAEAVQIVDQVGDQVSGCMRHAAVVLASVADARVYPGSVDGAAINAYTRAQLREPFEFDRVDPSPVPRAGVAAGGGR